MSGVTVLNLQSSILCETSLSRLLGGINALKSFTYDIYSTDSDYCESVDKIIGMLLQHAKASLESVAFTGPWELHRYYQQASCSFKDFDALRKIRMDLGCYLKGGEEYRWSSDGDFFDDWYDNIECLVDLLPVSVRSIELDGTVGIAEVSSLLKELPERKAKCIPHLKSVKFMDSHILCEKDDANNSWAHAWRKKCQKVGVRLSL